MTMKRIFGLLILVGAFACAPLHGQVVFDAATNGTCSDSGTGCTDGVNPNTVLTFSHTTGSGSNRAMAVGCTVSSGSATVMPNISTVTYAGVSLSQKAKRDANYDTYIWTLPDGTQPTTGTNNVVVIVAATLTTGGINCTAATFTGVNQTTAWTIADCTGAGTGTTASCTLGASGGTDMVVATECNGTSIGSPTGALTRRAFSNNTAGACQSNGLATAAGSTTAVSWNNNGNDSWQILAGALKAAGAAATPPHRVITIF